MASTWTSTFSLSITRALADQLADVLATLSPGPLTRANLEDIADFPGIYVLFYQGERVYVGKAAGSLRGRLGQHLTKLSGRRGIDVDAVEFMCVYVDKDLDASAPEKLLIRKYRVTGAVPWQTNGFGNKDPGKRRDHSLVEAKHFDAHYPIDLDTPVEVDATEWSVVNLLATAKRRLPYLLRYETKEPEPKIVLARTSVSLSALRLTAAQLMREVVVALPEGWQATALPGYLILYPKAEVYDSAQVWWRRRPDGTVEETPGPGRFSDRNVKIDEDEDGDDDE